MARLPLSSGDAVLDVCCGAGASALPAARAVGVAGSVLGLDLAEPLLELARERALADLLARGGVSGTTVQATVGQHHELERADDFWDIVLGSGYRATVDALGAAQREGVRERVVGELRARAVTRLRNDVVFARAVKPMPSARGRGARHTIGA